MLKLFTTFILSQLLYWRRNKTKSIPRKSIFEIPFVRKTNKQNQTNAKDKKWHWWRDITSRCDVM